MGDILGNLSPNLLGGNTKLYESMKGGSRKKRRGKKSRKRSSRKRKTF